MAAPIAPQDRIEAIDAVRGVALFGVLIVNLITAFRVSIFQQFLGSTAQGDADGLVERIVAVGFESKAFCLFALLFGVGLAIQFDRLSVTGRPFYWLARRLAVLLAFGLVHLLFIWNGDILTEYALAGFIVLPLLLLRRALLLIVAAGLLVVYVVGPMLYSVPWPDAATLRATWPRPIECIRREALQRYGDLAWENCLSSLRCTRSFFRGHWRSSLSASSCGEWDG